MSTKLARSLTIGLGVAVPVMTFTASEMHPPGHPERMAQEQVVSFAEAGAHQLWAGGVISMCSAMLLLALAALVVERVSWWTGGVFLTRVVESSMRLTAGVLAASGLMQFFAGVLATPSERVGADVVLIVLTVMQMHVLAAACCFLAPGALAVAASVGASRWLRVTSGILGIALLASIALPPVSWVPGFIWLIVVSIGVANARGA